MYSVFGSGLTCSCLAYFRLSSGSRSAGIVSVLLIQSAWPFSTWVTSACDAEAELLLDDVRQPRGLGVLRPLLEERVAHDAHRGRRLVLGPLVRPRPGRRDVHVLAGVSAGRTNANGSASCWRNSGSALAQVERDLVAVDHDALGEVAGLRRLDARVAALDRVVPGARVRAVADLEQALEGRLDVLAGHRLAVGELDPRAQRELVGAAVVGRRRHRRGEVGHDRRALGAARALEADEPVVGDDQELPLLQRVVDLRVGRPGRRRIGERDQGAALRAGRRVGARRGRRRRGPAATRARGLRRAAAGSDEHAGRSDDRRQDHGPLHRTLLVWTSADGPSRPRYPAGDGPVQWTGGRRTAAAIRPGRRASRGGGTAPDRCRARWRPRRAAPCPGAGRGGGRARPATSGSRRRRRPRSASSWAPASASSALPELRRDQAAERVAREVAERAARPVHVLQDAAGVVGDLDAEQPAHAVVPRGGQVGDLERALDQRDLELEAQDDVQRVGERVGRDADQRRLDRGDRARGARPGRP